LEISHSKIILISSINYPKIKLRRYDSYIVLTHKWIRDKYNYVYFYILTVIYDPKWTLNSSDLTLEMIIKQLVSVFHLTLNRCWNIFILNVKNRIKGRGSVSKIQIDVLFLMNSVIAWKSKKRHNFALD